MKGNTIYTRSLVGIWPFGVKRQNFGPRIIERCNVDNCSPSIKIEQFMCMLIHTLNGEFHSDKTISFSRYCAQTDLVDSVLDQRVCKSVDDAK